MVNTSKLSKYLRAEHVKDGDIINFMNGGKIEDRTFKENGVNVVKPILEMTVEVNGETKSYSPNLTTVAILSKAWGGNTDDWIAKQGRVTVLPGPNGRDMIICKPV